MSIGFCEDCNSTGGHASYCPRWRKDAMTTPTPRTNALVNVLAEWEDRFGAMAAIMPHEWADLFHAVTQACIVQSPRQLRRDLAAAQEARERAEKLVRELEQSMGVMASDGNHETRRSDSDVGPAERPRNAVTPTYSELQESLSVYVALAAAQSDRAQRAEERAAACEKDAERGRYMIANAAWHRCDDHDGRYASMVIKLPYEADLSCTATRETAIDAARAK